MYNTFKNRKPVFFSVLITALIVCLFQSPLSAHAEDSALRAKHFIWTVEGKRNTVYLMGSIHMLKPGAYPLPQAVEDVYGCCKRIVFETNMDTAGNSYFQNKRTKHGLYPPGQKLSEHISPQTYALLKDKMKAGGLSIEEFEKYRPWYIAQLLTGMEVLHLGFDPELGIDNYFFRKAKKDRKSLVFLETNDFQLDLMSKLREEDQDIFLKRILNDLDSIEKIAVDMLDAWKRGDVDKLRVIIETDFAGQPDNYDRLIVQRNKVWVKKIINFLKQNSDILLIVGAAHLVGKDSLIELLEQKGFTVTQK